MGTLGMWIPVHAARCGGPVPIRRFFQLLCGDDMAMAGVVLHQEIIFAGGKQHVLRRRICELVFAMDVLGSRAWYSLLRCPMLVFIPFVTRPPNSHSAFMDVVAYNAAMEPAYFPGT